jgi:hypothetical protein
MTPRACSDGAIAIELDAGTAQVGVGAARASRLMTTCRTTFSFVAPRRPPLDGAVEVLPRYRV